MERILILVHTCAAYEAPRCVPILKTWASHPAQGAHVRFATDNPRSNLPAATYMGPYPEGATYHPETFVKILKYFQAQKGLYEWFMVVDDDTYLFIERLLGWLALLDSRRSLLIGDFINWPPLYDDWRGVYQACMKMPPPQNYDYNLWPGGGPGLVFSGSCVDNILQAISELSAINSPALAVVNHDVWLHRIIEVQGQSRIARLHCPGFHQFGDKDLLKDENINTKSLISVHLNHDIGLMMRFHGLAVI